jgi:hypothetical protein
LYLVTLLFLPKLNFALAETAKLSGHMRSQVQLGNEGKLYLVTLLFLPKLNFALAETAKLSGHMHSQVQLGNEGKLLSRREGSG